MRYFISRLDNTIPGDVGRAVSEASNLEQATAQFNDAVSKTRPGYTVKLHDTKKVEVLKTFCVHTVADLEAEADRSHLRVVNRLAETNRDLLRLVERLSAPDADVAHAMEWSDGAFTDAAKVSIGRSILAARAQGHAWPVIIDDLRGRMQNGARYPKRSTSQCSNLMAQELLAVWTDTYETLKSQHEYFQAEIADAERRIATVYDRTQQPVAV